MKFVLLGFVLAFSCTCSASFFPGHLSESEIQNSLARIASLSLLQGFKDKLQADLSSRDAQTKVPVIPELPDPLVIEDFFVPLPEDSEFGEIIFGNLSAWNTSVTGLSSIHDNFEFQPTIPAVVVYTLSTETISLHGNHEIALNVSQTYFLGGQTDFELKVVDFFVDLNVKILVNIFTDKFQITDFSLDLGFQELSISLGETLINDEPIEWDIINKNVNCIFQVYWPILRDIFNPLILESLNELVKECVISDLVNGNFSCIGIEGGIQAQLEVELNSLLPALAGCQMSQIITGDWQCIQRTQLDNLLSSLIKGVQDFETLDFECPDLITSATESTGTTDGSATTDGSGTTGNSTGQGSSTTEETTTGGSTTNGQVSALLLVFLCTYVVA